MTDDNIRLEWAHSQFSPMTTKDFSLLPITYRDTTHMHIRTGIGYREKTYISCHVRKEGNVGFDR